MAKKKGSSGVKEIRKNEAGEIITWDSNSRDGQLLKLLFDNGTLTSESTKEVKELYANFRKYATKTLSSAITNVKKSVKREAEARKAKGSKGMSLFVNLP